MRVRDLPGSKPLIILSLCLPRLWLWQALVRKGTCNHQCCSTRQEIPLTDSPFVKYLHIGRHNDGYWICFPYEVKLEDVVDCLNVIHPEFDHLFLFDHSQGNARKRDGALNASKMRKGCRIMKRKHPINTGRMCIWRTVTKTDMTSFSQQWKPNNSRLHAML